MEHLVVVPWAMSEPILAIFDEHFDDDQREGIGSTDLREGLYDDIGLTLDFALARLDRWHTVNVWANDPVVYVMRDIDQDGVMARVSEIIHGPDSAERSWLLSQYESAAVEQILNGPTEEYKQLMAQLRDMCADLSSVNVDNRPDTDFAIEQRAFGSPSDSQQCDPDLN